MFKIHSILGVDLLNITEKFFPIFPTINERCRPRNLRVLILYGNHLTEQQQTPYKIWKKQQ